MNPYESEKILSEYVLFHYGTARQILPDGFAEMERFTGFAVRCVSETLRLERLPTKARALDVGCAVGRSSFELARHCQEVIGIDFSQRFIAAAQEVQKAGAARFARTDEGLLTTVWQSELPAEIARERVAFETGDATALRDDLGSFDVVLAANLIDRLPAPLAFLRRLPELVNAGGQLILTSPYTWLEEFTPRENWLGGFVQENGERLTTLQRLETELEPNFELETVCDLPFLIREHARKFQWSVAQASVWIRRQAT